MGFRICYIASKLDPNEMVAALGLQIVGNEDEMPDSSWWIAVLKKSGWSVLWSEDEEFGARSRDQLADLSHKADLVHCEVNETVMWSSSEFWSKGKSVWNVTHAGDGDDRFDLNTKGELPSQFSDIKEQQFQTQKNEEEDVDHIFEIPLDLAKSYIGFRHEDFLQRDDVDEFRIIAAPPKAGFLSRIFGGNR